MNKHSPFRPGEGATIFKNAVFRLMVLCAVLTFGILSPCMAKPLVVEVRDTSGQPMPHAHVRLHAPQGSMLKPVSSLRGCYRFEVVPTGYNALLVTQAGYQRNGFQWFVAQPDTVYMVMHKGEDVVLFDGDNPMLLRFDPRRLVVGPVKGASEAAFAEFLHECQLDLDPQSGFCRWKAGQAIPEFNSDVLQQLQRSPLVDIACTYAERADRVLSDEFETFIVEDPKDLKKLHPTFWLQGQWDLTFEGGRLEKLRGHNPLTVIDSVLRQYGFCVEAKRYGEASIDLQTALTHSSHLAVKSISGLSGTFLIGQLAQLRACPLVRSLKYGNPYLQD